MELLQSSLVAQGGEAAYDTLRMQLLITVEEGAEMLGVALLVRTLLGHLARESDPAFALRFEQRRAAMQGALAARSATGPGKL